MDRRATLVMAGALLVALIIGALATSGTGGKDSEPIVRPQGVPANAKAVDGRIADIAADNLVIASDDGDKELALTPRYARAVDVQHLVQVHQAGKQPVRVFYENQNGDDVAIAAVDLPPPG